MFRGRASRAAKVPCKVEGSEDKGLGFTDLGFRVVYRFESLGS